MLQVTFIGSLCKINGVRLLCSKIADGHGTKVHGVRIKNLFTKSNCPSAANYQSRTA